LETAHVLGERHVVPHFRSQWLMPKIGLGRRSVISVIQVFGQVVRIALGALGSAVGLVSIGNTGTPTSACSSGYHLRQMLQVSYIKSNRKRLKSILCDMAFL
jgi:hypothetical protein